MLRQLYVKDFAIIEHAVLELGAGMTVLTGETGAGKSLLVDALLLLSGARGDAGWLRDGAERAELAAEFDLPADSPLRARLADLDLDESSGPCRIRRVLRRDGSSRAYLNDRPVSLSLLRELAAGLIEIHGQHEHQALLEPASQLALLDAQGRHEDALLRVRESSRRIRELRAELAAVNRSGGTGDARADWLRFQLDELERYVPAPQAWQELEQEHRRLSHAGDLSAGAELALDRLAGEREEGASRQLTRTVNELARLAGLDPRIAQALAPLQAAVESVNEATHALERYRDQLELEPGRLAELETRVARVVDLARKHRCATDALPAHAEALRVELQGIEQSESRGRELAAAIAASESEWRQAASELTRRRRLAAEQLGRGVEAVLPELGMAGGRFEVAFSAPDPDAYSVSGAESVEFTISTNAGQAPRALRRIASGGELSRISLAIEVAALDPEAVPTMVFDEVDSGIGGAVAEVVGRKLRALGELRQVLCVTHLPQVAAQAHRQVVVSKGPADGAVRVQVEVLDDRSRAEEIARMLGGITITEQTRRHAREMLRAAEAAPVARRQA